MVEQTNYAPEPQTAVCGKICGIRPRRITPSWISTILQMILSVNVTKKSRPYRLPSQMIGKTCLTRLVLVNWVVLLRHHSVLYGCMSNCKMSIKSSGTKTWHFTVYHWVAQNIKTKWVPLQIQSKLESIWAINLEHKYVTFSLEANNTDFSRL